MSEPSFRKFVLKYTNIPQYRSPLDKTTFTYTVNFDIANLLYFSYDDGYISAATTGVGCGCYGDGFIAAAGVSSCFACVG